MPSIRIVLSKHANDRRILYGLSKEQIKRCIQIGGRINQTNGYLASYTYLKVAYKKIDKNLYYVKTVYIKK